MLALLAASALLSGQDLKGKALLDDLSHRAVTYFWEQSHPTTGLTRDRAPNKIGGVENNPNIASVASTGYALAAYAVGVNRGWLDREEALVRTKRTLNSILNLVESKNGWYFHFVDWNTGKREWNCEVSSIDSGLLFAGMLIADAALRDKEISILTRMVMNRVDWKWMLTDGGEKPSEVLFCHGWKPESGFIKWRWGSFSEHMFLYVLGYGWYDEMPANSWASFERPLVEYQGLKLLGGGPLFMHQMSQGFFDFRNYRDALGYDYFVEGRNATLANRRYCESNPEKFQGYSSSIWGLSACDIPDGYGAQGAPGWISDNGTLAPASAVASVIYTPKLSTFAAEAFLREYPQSFGRYGFTTGINPTKKWQSPDVIGIDLGQMMLNIEIARDGSPYQWMMNRTETRKAYARIGLKRTIERGDRELRRSRNDLMYH